LFQEKTHITQRFSDYYKSPSPSSSSAQPRNCSASSALNNLNPSPFPVSKSRVRQFNTAFAASIPEAVTPATP